MSQLVTRVRDTRVQIYSLGYMSHQVLAWIITLIARLLIYLVIRYSKLTLSPFERLNNVVLRSRSNDSFEFAQTVGLFALC
jgi:hypothetical protein